MRIRWALAIGLGLAASACQSDGTADPPPPTDDAAINADAGPLDATADAGPRDAAADAGPRDAAADAGPSDAAPDAAPPEPCDWPADCPMGDCIDGRCVYEVPARCPEGDESLCPEGETCGGFANRYYCFKPCEAEQTCPLRPRPCATHGDCPFGTSCHDERCINSCLTDLDCGADGYCVDGECRPYPEDLWGGDPAEPLGEPGQLYAGVAVVPLDYPIGVSPAGYGGRVGPSTPYNFSLGGTDRFLDGQDVRVLALSDDRDVIIVVRLPTGWSTDFMLTLTALKLQELTRSPAHPDGVDYRGKIVTSATHSHSQPGRYWNLFPSVELGIFGYGTFSPEMVHRYTDTFARAIKAALDDMQPASFGYAVIAEFDPERRIHSDRRGETPASIDRFDDRMFVWRVDDAEGRPLAALVNFAIHGTHMNLPWITGDVAGGIEVVLTEKLSAVAGRPVPVMFANGNAGDVSPRGDDAVSEPWAKIQAVGHRVWPIFRAAFEGITPRADVALEIVTRRIPFGYDEVGYRDGEFRSDRSPRPHYYGGFQCVVEGRDPDEEPYEDGDLRCRLNLETFLGVPVVQFGKTVLTAFRIGDLVVATLPGEPTSGLGMMLREAIEETAAAAGETVTAMTLGYAQDHQLYLLEAEDWLHGGYEASMSVWGWRVGEHIVARSVELAGQLFTDEKEPNDTGLKPTWWPELVDDTVTPTPTPDDARGTVMTDPPERVARGALIEVAWTGGHPGVDLPVVRLERRADDGGWVPALRPGGLPYDNAGFETLTIYRGDYEADHTWVVRWELGFDLPLGTYRLYAEGHAVDTEGQRRAYAAASRPFEVEPATLALRAVAVGGGRIGLMVNYPEGPSNDDGASPFERLEARGHWLRYDADRDLDGPAKRYALLLGPPLPTDAPVRVTLDGPAPAEAEVTPVADTVTVPLVTARDAQGQETVTEVPDWPSARVEIDAPAVPGEYTLTVTDPHGNTGRVTLTVPAP